jgi:hypothetical protein
LLAQSNFQENNLTTQSSNHALQMLIALAENIAMMHIHLDGFIVWTAHKVRIILTNAKDDYLYLFKNIFYSIF